MSDESKRYPERIRSQETNLSPDLHFTRDHIENIPIGDRLKQTPSSVSIAMDKAEQAYYKMHPRQADESLAAYAARIAPGLEEVRAQFGTGKSQEFFIQDIQQHQLEDSYDTNTSRPGTDKSYDTSSNQIGYFGGSSTSTNYLSKAGTVPEGETTAFKKQVIPDQVDNGKIIRDVAATRGIAGLDDTDSGFTTSDKNGEDANTDKPISPLYPFFRMDPTFASQTILTSYNRNKIPIADIEHRKAFRHIFIGRPECYLFARGGVPSEQLTMDPMFSSTLKRMPHIVALLSPHYCTPGLFAQPTNTDKRIQNNCNWNYLLSNRAEGMSVTSNTILKDENMVKSVSGYTITPGTIDASSMSGELTLTFRDTKKLEITEFFRLWMLYIYKRKRGSLSPSFDDYKPVNEYMSGLQTGISNKVKNHPYDRALEYCVPIFDIVTDETMTNIIHWTKYYGAFPTESNNNGLSSEGSNALTEEMKLSVTFHYQAKRENLNHNLLEFNFNAGIVDEVGHLREGLVLSHSSPWLYRDTDQYRTSYMGAAGMFTGTPYIVIEEDTTPIPGMLPDQQRIRKPQLRFMELPFETDAKLHANGILSKPEITNQYLHDNAIKNVGHIT